MKGALERRVGTEGKMMEEEQGTKLKIFDMVALTN